MDLKQRLRDIDKETVDIIDRKYGLLNILDAMAGYLQTCNMELVEIKKAVNEHLFLDVNPLTDDQKRTLRHGGDMIKNVRAIIGNGKSLKDKEVLNADFGKVQKHKG